MKAKALFGLAAITLALPSHADVVVEITGATAFRAAALTAVRAQFNASGQPYQFSHDQASGGYTGATRAIFKGTFPGVSGQTIVRTSFNGSVEGIRALVDSPASDPTYYSNIAGNFITAAAVGGGETHTSTPGFSKTTESAQSDIAFSDVSKSSTPYASFSLQPSNSAAGVVVFTMLANQGSPITNVTSQQFRGLMNNGFLPLSMFTGDEADSGNYVFGTGRNDGSGTRTTYLAETGYGITKLVKQYLTTATSGDTITSIQLVPAGGGSNPSNASTVWGQDVAGNGGYSSGSTLRGDMARSSTAVTVLDELGDDIFGEPIDISLVTWLSLNDAVTARNGGAVFCAYNGVKLNDIAASGSTMSAADKAKVTQGAYTAWGYQQMYRRNDLVSGDTVTVYNAIKTGIPANLAAAGIAIGDMAVGREVDGGVVAP